MRLLITERLDVSLEIIKKLRRDTKRFGRLYQVLGTDEGYGREYWLELYRATVNDSFAYAMKLFREKRMNPIKEVKIVKEA